MSPDPMVGVRPSPGSNWGKVNEFVEYNDETPEQTGKLQSVCW